MTHRERTTMDDGRRRSRTAALAAVLAAALALPLSASADITLTSTPDELVQLGELTGVAWAETIRCNVNYGRVPGAYTDETAAWGWDSLVFTPENEGMTHGIYYCIVSEMDGPETSDEFVLIVDSPVAPSPTGPPNGSTVTETTTLLEWDAVDGVPYYHVLVSDHEIDVAEEDGELVVSGANIVWQAITSAASIQYGSPDPSGYFLTTNGTSPPLMSGFDYHWLVFNNYGNNPLLTSTARAGIAAFYADVPVSMTAPALTAPADSTAISDEYVDFSWTPSTGASGYHLYIYETREWNRAEASFPVWDGPSPTPSAQVQLGSFLIPGSYKWRVVALDSSGRGIASETRGFEYSTETGTARIRTKKMDGSDLGNAYVEIEFLEGGVSALPTVTDANGHSNVELIPGEYAFHASRSDYVDTTATALIEADASQHVIIHMRRAPARMRGVVRDEGGAPVFDADVHAARGDDLLEAASDPAGNFVVQASAGTWLVHAEKPGHAPSAQTEVVLHADDYLDIGELTLVGTPGSASGNVVNAAGGAIVGATVEAVSSFGTSSAFTNANGYFLLELAPGEWSITAAKSGFIESDPRSVTVEPGEGTPVDPPIVLETAGSAVMGRVTDGRANFANARVVATPPAGGVIETTTNTFGEFLLTLPADFYELTAEVDGHATSVPHHVDVNSGESYVGVELEVVAADCTIEGTVNDGENPVEGALVTDGDAAVETGADGAFAISVGPGLRELTAHADGHLAGGPLLVGAAAGGHIEGLELTLTPGASTISGTAMSGAAPVAGALVTAVSGASEVATKSLEDGTYALSVEAGEWTVTADKDGFTPSGSEIVFVASGQEATGVDPELESECAYVAGDVSDSRSLVPGAALTLYPATSAGRAYTTTSDTDGRYSLRVGPGVAYTAVVRGPAHGTVEHSIAALSIDEERALDVSLPPTDSSISGTLTFEGEGVPGALVETDGDRATTNAHGDYELRVNAGTHDVAVACPGYEMSYFPNVTATAGEVTELDAVLVGEHATVHGVVISNSTGTPVEGALVTAAWDGGRSQVTGPDGAFSLGFVVPGTVGLTATRAGYIEWSEVLSLAADETLENDIELVRHSGSIAGRVTDFDTGMPLAGVSVRARLGQEIASSDLTGADGRYTLEGLDPSFEHDVHASRAGYAAASANPVAGVAPDASDIDFVLAECAGVIAGLVLDGVDGEPLAGASVTANNGQGHFGSASTGVDGSFVIDGLASIGAYDVTAALYGYFDLEEVDVTPGGEPLTMNMPRNFARLIGTLTPEGGGVEIEETMVVATNIAFAHHSRTAAPDELGAYEIAELRPGSYVLSVTGGAHLGTPPQTSLMVGEGEVVSGLDFTVERAAIERIEIEGPTELPAGGRAVYSGSVFAQNERLVDTDLEWRVSPDCAGSASRTSGEIEVAAGYFGEMTVAALEPASGTVGRSSADVYVTATPEGGAAATDSLGASLSVPAGAVTESKSIYVMHELLPSALRYSRGHMVEEIAYHLKPCGLPFDAGHEPTLSVPDESGVGELVAWDHGTLAWTALEADRYAGDLECEIAALGRFAVRTRTGPLSVSDVEATPDPFSPENGPVTISYELSSNDARTPFVTVRVFNMNGQLVRKLVSNEPQGKGRASVEWDGLTDASEVARNGRYVVEVSVEDSTGTESALGTVVLVK